MVVDDLALCVIDDAGVETVSTCLGSSHGAPSRWPMRRAIPERVRKLVLVGGYAARAGGVRADPRGDRAGAQAIVELSRRWLELPTAALLGEMFITLYCPRRRSASDRLVRTEIPSAWADHR